MVTGFIPGLELASLYYWGAVRPILDAEYPSLTHSAGLIGSGSEVLGFDTEMSADHNWGAQVILYLSEEDHIRLADDLYQTLGYKLPFSFRGYPTHFGEVPDEPRTVLPVMTSLRPIEHRVHVTTMHGARLCPALYRRRSRAGTDSPGLVDHSRAKTSVTGSWRRLSRRPECIGADAPRICSLSSRHVVIPTCSRMAAHRAGRAIRGTDWHPRG